MQKSKINKMIENISSLSIEEQEFIIQTISKRIHEARRDKIASRVKEAEHNYKTGNVASGTPKDLLKTIEGTFRNGKIELAEIPKNIKKETRVIVTFLESGEIDLSERGIDEAQAADLRGRLATFTEDWDSPEMEAYDNYDAAKAKL